MCHTHAPFHTPSTQVWPSVQTAEEAATCHRVVILVTDGLTQENRPEDYEASVKDRGFKMGILNVRDSSVKATELADAMIRGLQTLRGLIDIEQVSDTQALAKCVGQLLLRQFKACLGQVESTARLRRGASVASRGMLPSNAAVLHTPGSDMFGEAASILKVVTEATGLESAAKKGAGGKPKKMYVVGQRDIEDDAPVVDQQALDAASQHVLDAISIVTAVHAGLQAGWGVDRRRIKMQKLCVVCV